MKFTKTHLFIGLLALWAAVFYLTSRRPVRAPDGLAASLTSEPSVLKPSREAAGLEDAFIRVAETVKPAVVNISTVYTEKIQSPQYEFFFGSPFDDFFEEFFGAPRSRARPRAQPRTRRHEGTGSGVVISADGYILTNEHVVRNADEITVTLSAPDGSEKKYKGKIIGKDARTDLAVIKIPVVRFSYARLGDSDKIRVGQWVVAIGSPFGLEQTVTTGIVSAKRQALSIEGRTYRDLIQTDAAINRGNSGGPLCNIAGEVIGINTAIYAPTGVFSGIGFAVPINRAKDILEEMIKTGKVTRGWLGVEIRPIDAAIEKNFKLKSRDGAFVANVLDKSPAAAAGINRGDVITEFDGKKIRTPAELQDAVAAVSPGKKASVRVLRDGKELRLEAALSEMPSEPGAEGGRRTDDGGDRASHKWEGASLSDATADIRSELALPADAKGVAVLDVEDYSRASSIGLMAGDLIMSVNRKNVSSLEEFKKAAAGADPAKGVVLDVLRGGRRVFLTYSEE